MTRQEAIDLVVDTWRGHASEFCVGDAERADSDQECRDVLAVLGCTPDEIATAELKPA